MSALSVVKEYRGMGDSWPKAIGLGITNNNAVMSVRAHVGSGIFRVGERITSLGEGIRSAQWDTSREKCWRDGVQTGMETGIYFPKVAQRHVDEAERRCEDWWATKV
jgi:hypothetical protein